MGELALYHTWLVADALATSWIENFFGHYSHIPSANVRGLSTEPITGSRLAAWILWAAFVVVQLLRQVRLFSTPWTAAR